MKKHGLRFVTLFAVCSLFLAACGSTEEVPPTPLDVVSSEEVVAEGRLEPIHATNLAFLSRGVVEEVLVQAGDAVREADVLVRLTNAGGAEAQVVIAQNAYDSLLRNEGGDRAKFWQTYLNAQIVRAEAEQEWEDLNVDDIDERIEDLEADVEDRKSEVTDAQEEFDKYKDLDEDNSKRKDAEDDLEQAQEDLNQTLRDLEEEIRNRDEVFAAYEGARALEAEAKYQYEISMDGPNAEQLTLAKAQLDAAKDTLANYVITAPFDGVVAEVNVKAGEQVGADVRAVSVADFSTWILETTDVTELEVVKLYQGQQVRMIPDALPDLELVGEVTQISNAYLMQGGDIIYTVTIHVNQTDPRLRWGMTVEATFLEPVSD